jgi:serine/threonine-protein kinase
MPIAAGARFGPYEVVSALGAGGMGEVYRARDTKLGRDVALKVLPESFAADPDRLARFRREAQLLASLNHPHIGAIYGLEDAERPALVLELVEGPTLANRIEQGPIPLDEALAIARQIAEALEAAHDKGIIHRDLKPANIKLTPDDKVKVLDFGLAKLSEAGEAHGSAVASLSPTMLSPAAMTHAGVILGTAAYMSPEQARGKAVDRRVDIWAFGCVLFEMLSGRRPFEAGETVSDAVAAVLRGDPDWLALPADTPSAVRWLIRRCLEKDPQARVAHIAAARYELDRPTEPVAAPVVQTASSSRGRSAGLTAAAMAGALVTALAAWRLIPDAPVVGVTRFSVPIVTEIQLPNAPTQVIAISRDGRQIVYGGSRLYRRLLSEREAIPIPGTEAVLGSASQPVFSPDGTSIAFVTGSPGRASLKRIDLGGGPAATLTDVLLVLGMSWDASGILYAEARRGIVRISPTGGEPEVLVPQDVNKPGEQSFQGPRMLPDGKTLIYGIVGASLDFDDAQIVAQRIGSTERRVLVRGGTDARYIPTGHLVYASRGVLYAVAFDAETLTVGERPVPVIQGVMGTAVNTTGSAFYDVSDNGTLWYVPGGTTAGDGRTLMAIDRSGAMQTLKISPGAYEAPRLSPDGTFVAFELAEGSERNIWIYNLSGASSMRRLTFGGSDRFPVWSADGRRVTYQSTRDGDSAIYWQLADGTGPAERLTKPAAGEAHVPESWSPRGDFLLLESRRQDSITMHVLAMRDRTVSQFGSLASTFPFGPAFSPDGRWVAYSTLLPGAVGRGTAGVVTNAVFIEPFPPTGAKYQVSKDDDGHHPVWTANGRELIYTRGPGQVAAVAITPTPTFSFSEPMPLGAGMMSISPAQRRGHDPMPDGRRFVAAISARADGGRADVTGEVVVNWFEELKRLVER